MSTRLINKYTASAETILKTIKTQTRPMTIDPQTIQNVIKHAKAYLEDSKYYLHKRKLSVSLTSIAYCEGLLDTLKLIGAAEFEWPTKNKQETGK
jgi:hypothetical protein